MTQAHFKEIRNKIIEHIGNSKEEILICVAWFTSKEILGKLIDKAESGCKIKILISDHFENKRLNFKEFQNKNGLINILSTNTGKFLHDKFAVFDKRKVILDRKSTRLNSSHVKISYAVFCLKKKKIYK